MKVSRLALLASFVAPALSMAASNAALLTKSNYPGFVMPAMVRSQSCSIFSDRVEIKRGLGYSTNGQGIGVTETRPLTFQGDLTKVIAEAAKEQTTQKDNGLCDGPSTAISARNGDNDTQGLVLYSSGGCGTPSVERKGYATQMLVDLINDYCPGTVGNPLN